MDSASSTRRYNRLEYFQLEEGELPRLEVPSVDSRWASSKEDKRRILWKVFYVAVLVAALCLVLNSYKSSPLEGNVLSKSIPLKQVTHPEPVSPLWGTVSKPYPTGAFWTNLVVENGDYPVTLGAYDVKTLPTGVQVSYSATRRSVSQMAIIDAFDVDLQVGSAEQYVSRAVQKFDNLSVTMQYQTANGGKYMAYLVKGSVFVTVEFQGATPVISSANMHIISMVPQISAGGSTASQQYLVTLGNYQQWLLYSSSSISLTCSGDSITAAGPMNGVIRLVSLPLQNVAGSVAVLQPYLPCYPTGGSVSLSYPNQQQVSINFQFTTAGKGPLLMFAYPHHVAAMTVPVGVIDPTTASSKVQQVFTPIFSMKGQLQTVVGTTWKLQLNLAQVNWNYNLVTPLSNNQLDQIAAHLMNDIVSNLPIAQDVYSFAKQMGRMAQLALIADNLGIPDLRQQGLSALELAILPWLLGTQTDSFVYDKTYGGVVTSEGVQAKAVDFGSGWYNDHHFHFGYLVFAAAVIARFDNPFYTANSQQLDSLVRDICNPDPTDVDFPTARHKDFFDGHSWATGLISQSNGKNQESSSEVSAMERPLGNVIH
jgi:endo-1,3(4)-beta-glucanase